MYNTVRLGMGPVTPLQMTNELARAGLQHEELDVPLLAARLKVAPWPPPPGRPGRIRPGSVATPA